MASKFGGDISVLIGADTAQFQAALRRASGEMSAFAGKAEATGAKLGSIQAGAVKAGASLTRHLTLPILGVGIAATDMALKFNDKMVQIQTQAGASAAEVKRMSTAVLQLAKVTPEGPNALADGLYRIESAGIRGRRALEALTASAHLAAVGHSDMEQTTYALVSAMKAGISGAQNLSQAIGTINATVGEGNMRMNDLTASFATGILPVAKAVGINLTEVGAALDLFTNRGKPAQQSATGLTRAFSQMEAPAKSAVKALADMGIGQKQLAEDLKSGGLVKAVDDLRAHFDVMPDKIRATQDVMEAFGRSKGGAQMLLLVQNAEALSRGLDQVRSHADTFAQDLAATQATAEYKVKTSWSNIQASLIQTGNMLMPIAAQVAQFASGVISAFSRMSESSQKIVLIGVGVVAALGPAISVIGRLIGAVRALGVAMEFVASGPFGMFVGVATVIAGLVGYRLASAFFGAKQSVDEFTRSLQAAANVMGQAVKGHSNLDQATRNLAEAHLQVVSSSHQVELMHQQIAAGARAAGMSVADYATKTVQGKVAVDELNQMLAMHNQYLADAKRATGQWSEANRQALEPLVKLHGTITGAIDKTQKLAVAEAAAQKVLAGHAASLTDAEAKTLNWAAAQTAAGSAMSNWDGKAKDANFDMTAMKEIMSLGQRQAQEYADGMRRLASRAHDLSIVFKSEHKPAAEAAALALSKTALAAAGLATSTGKIPKSVRIRIEANKDYVDLLAETLGRVLPDEAKKGTDKTSSNVRAGLANVVPVAQAGGTKIGSAGGAAVAPAFAARLDAVAMAASARAAFAYAAAHIGSTAGEYTAAHIGRPGAEGLVNAFIEYLRTNSPKMKNATAQAFKMAADVQPLIEAAGRMLGADQAQSIVDGILGKMPGVAGQITTALRQAMHQAMQAAQQQVQQDMGNLASALSSIGSNIQGAISALGPGFGTRATRGLGGQLTAEQAALAAQQQQEQLDRMNDAISKAQTQLQKDLAAGASPDVLAADQQAIADATQQLADYQSQLKIAADQKALAEQQKRDRDNLEKQYAALEKEIKAHPERAAKLRVAIDNLLKKYGITPASVQATQDWNAAQSLFVSGMGDLKKSMDALTVATERLADLQDGGTASGGGGMPHLATGGPTDGGLAVLHSGEYVLRASATRALGRSTLDKLNRLPHFVHGGFYEGDFPDLTFGDRNPLVGAGGGGSGTGGGSTVLPPSKLPWLFQMAPYQQAIDSKWPGTFTWDESRQWPTKLAGLLKKRQGEALSSISGDKWHGLGIPVSLAGLLNSDSFLRTQHGGPSQIARLTDFAIRVIGSTDYRSMRGIPQARTGGLVQEDTLAMVHKGEAILPLPPGQRVGGGTTHVHLYIGPEEVAQAVVGPLLRAKQLGRTGLSLPPGYH